MRSGAMVRALGVLLLALYVLAACASDLRGREAEAAGARRIGLTPKQADFLRSTSSALGVVVDGVTSSAERCVYEDKWTVYEGAEPVSSEVPIASDSLKGNIGTKLDDPHAHLTEILRGAFRDEKKYQVQALLAYLDVKLDSLAGACGPAVSMSRVGLPFYTIEAEPGRSVYFPLQPMQVERVVTKMGHVAEVATPSTARQVLAPTWADATRDGSGHVLAPVLKALWDEAGKAGALATMSETALRLEEAQGSWEESGELGSESLDGTYHVYAVDACDATTRMYRAIRDALAGLYPGSDAGDVYVALKQDFGEALAGELRARPTDDREAFFHDAPLNARLRFAVNAIEQLYVDSRAGCLFDRVFTSAVHLFDAQLACNAKVLANRMSTALAAAHIPVPTPPVDEETMHCTDDGDPKPPPNVGADLGPAAGPVLPKTPYAERIYLQDDIDDSPTVASDPADDTAVFERTTLPVIESAFYEVSVDWTGLDGRDDGVTLVYNYHERRLPAADGADPPRARYYQLVGVGPRSGGATGLARGVLTDVIYRDKHFIALLDLVPAALELATYAGVWLVAGGAALVTGPIAWGLAIGIPLAMGLAGEPTGAGRIIDSLANVGIFSRIPAVRITSEVAFAALASMELYDLTQEYKHGTLIQLLIHAIVLGLGRSCATHAGDPTAMEEAATDLLGRDFDPATGATRIVTGDRL